jgi:hypothetical protein
MFDDKFKSELMVGEKIVWTGQPDSSILFTKADILLVPVSALWWGFALFWEGSALFLIPEDSPNMIFFLLFGLIFVIVGFYYTIGRFFYRKMKRKRTYYAVTDKRILILSKLWGKKDVQTAYISSLPSINKSVNTKGVGVLIFGDNSINQATYANSGLEILGWGGKIAPIFYDIKDADEVYKKVTSLQGTQPKS